MFNNDFIQKLKQHHDCRVFPSLSSEKLEEAEIQIGPFPKDLKELYKITNGLECESFRILPIVDSSNRKKTWDSICRANKIEETKFSLDSNSLSKFLVFGEMEGRHAVMFSRNDGTIWYEDDEGYHQTDLNLQDLILGLLEE